MKEKELARFIYEGIEYIIGVSFWITGIPSPYIMITSKSSKKIRGKSIEKREAHFRRVNLRNPIGFYKKVYPIFEKELLKYNVVHFSAHDDSRAKRERVYQSAIEKMGYHIAYIYEVRYSHRDFIMVKNGVKIKRKEIKNLLMTYYLGD